MTDLIEDKSNIGNKNNTIRIEKISEFMQFVEELSSQFCLSRGQTEKYKLLPSALRLDESGHRKYSKKVISYFLKEFKINSHGYLKYPWDIKNTNEWMFIAQHYGIPTKLLDFTYSHIVALMFAVERAFLDDDDKKPEVWFLNPNKLNLKFANRNEILNISEIEPSTIENYDGPVVIKGRKLDERIKSQNGLFVCFQNESKALEDLVDESILKRIIIKGEYKKDILSSLYSMGIGFTSIYPELGSVSKDIIMKNNINEYIREVKQDETI